MKKTLLAAALTVGFFGVAQAETSVTLYGILDGGVGYQRLSDGDDSAKKFGPIQGVQSGNRWGLKGSEDLGEGLRVVFQLESGFGVASGHSQQNGRLFGRQSTLGLAGDSWGQIDLGRQTNIASKYFGDIDPFALGFAQANAGSSFTSANTVRYDNMLMYQTPNFSGFQFGVGYSFNIDGAQSFKVDEDMNTRAITTGLRYVNGPLAAALTYDTFKAKGAVLGGDDVTVKAWALGAAYDFEVVKAHLAFGQTRNGLFVGSDFSGLADGFVASDDVKFNSYLVGVSAPVGNGKLMASWQMADPRGEFKTDEEASKQQVYSLGYTYNLSKRTNVYAVGSYAKNVYFSDDIKSTLVGVGLRHQF